MKIIQQENTVVSSGIIDSVAFGIKQGGFAHIFTILRSQLYSDAVLACIREYTTNSVDSHTEAGKPNIPIQVTLPSKFNLVFKVRDFGFGMTQEQVFATYSMYGESTKRNSNELTGQLGIGSKSAFAYGDSFVISSFVKGKKTTYNAYIDVTQVGQIAKLATEDATEPDGLEISIPVKGDDVQAFHDKAFALFKYFKVKPDVIGANFKYETQTPLVEGKDWRIFGGDTAVAVMGNIGYPIENHWNNPEISNTLQAGIVVDFNIGDLEISASREKLRYSERTKVTIEKKLLSIVSEVRAELNKKFAGCSCYFDALKLFGSIMDYSSVLYPLRGLVAKSLTFNGKVISSNNLTFKAPTNDEFVIRVYSKTYRGNRITSHIASFIDCDEKTLVLENDTNSRNGINNRVYNPVTVEQKRVYVISFASPKAKQDFMADSQMVQANFTSLASLPKISLATGSTGGVKNSKHSSKEFVYDLANVGKLTWRSKNSDYWTQESVDVANDTGVYVIIDQFKYANKCGSFVDPSELKVILNSLASLGIKPKVYGFKAKCEATVKANKNMVSLWTYINDELTKYFAANNVSQKLANRVEYDKNKHHNWLNFVEEFGDKADKKGVCAKTYKMFIEMKSEADQKILDSCVVWKDYVKTTKPEMSLSDVAAAFEKEYPLIQSLRGLSDNAGYFEKPLLQYIALIDKI